MSRLHASRTATWPRPTRRAAVAPIAGAEVLADEGAQEAARLEAIADADPRGSPGELSHEPIVDVVGDDHPPGGVVALAGGEERAHEDFVHRPLEIAAPDHDGRPLSAALQEGGQLGALEAGLAQLDRGLVRSAEQQRVDPRVGRQPLAVARPRSLDQVERAPRQAAAIEGLGDPLADPGGELGRLEHHGVARQQGGGGVQGGDQQRQVVRDEDPDHPAGPIVAAGLPLVEDAGIEQGHALVQQQIHRPDRGDHLLAGLPLGLAGLAGDQVGELLLLLGQHVAVLANRLAAVHPPHPAPVDGSALGALHRVVHRRLAERETTENIAAIAWIDPDDEPIHGFRFDPGSPDVVAAAQQPLAMAFQARSIDGLGGNPTTPLLPTAAARGAPCYEPTPAPRLICTTSTTTCCSAWGTPPWSA